MEVPQNRRFCRDVEILALWPIYIGEKGRTSGKTYGIKVRGYWEHPWGTYWEPNGNLNGTKETWKDDFRRGSRDQWIQVILLVESFILISRKAFRQGCRTKKWQIEAKPTWPKSTGSDQKTVLKGELLIWRTKNQARDQGTAQLKYSICFKSVQIGS